MLSASRQHISVVTPAPAARREPSLAAEELEPGTEQIRAA
jgi:hypothetical protein